MHGQIRAAGKLDYCHGTVLALNRVVAANPGLFADIQPPP